LGICCHLRQQASSNRRDISELREITNLNSYYNGKRRRHLVTRKDEMFSNFGIISVQFLLPFGIISAGFLGIIFSRAAQCLVSALSVKVTESNYIQAKRFLLRRSPQLTLAADLVFRYGIHRYSVVWPSTLSNDRL
jgi:hypothetical protein